MREAQASIKLDVSQFEKSIESAKSKIASLTEAVAKAAAKIATLVAAFVAIKNIVEYTNFAARSVKYLEEIFGKSGRGMIGVLHDIKETAKESFTTFSESIQTISKSTVSGLEQLKKSSQNFGAFTKNIPQGFKNITLGVTGTVAGLVFFSRMLGVVGSAISISVGLIGKTFSTLLSILKGVASFVGSAFSVALNILKGSLKAVAVGAVALTGAITAMVAFISRGVVGIFQMADELKRMRDITGASVPFLMSLQKAFKESGLSAEQVIPVLSEMNRSISATNEKGQPSSRAIKEIGLSVKELSALTPDQKFKTIAESISQVGDKGLQTAYAMDIFGRFGRNVLAVISDTNAVKNFGSSFDRVSKIMAENIDRFARIGNKIKNTGTLFRGFFTEIAGAVAPQVEFLLDMLGKGDFLSGLGQKIADQLKFGLDVFVGAIASGKISEAMKTALSIPILYFKDLFSRSVETIGNIFRDITKKNQITILFTTIPAKSLLSSFGIALADLFKSVSKLFAVVLIEQLRTPLAALEIAFENIAIGFVTMLGKELINKFLPQLNLVAKMLGFSGLGDAIEKAMATAGSLLGRKPTEKTFSERVAERERERRGEGFLDFGFGTVGENIQNVGGDLTEVLNALKDIGQVVVSNFKNMGGITEETQKKMQKAMDELEKLRAKGADIVRRADLSRSNTVTGGIAPAERLPVAPVVASIQRIGGGGGAFAGFDPILQNAKEQTDLQRRIVAELEKQTKQAEKSGGLILEPVAKAMLA